jgi:chemotaxis protein methyltransferase CheR
MAEGDRPALGAFPSPMTDADFERLSSFIERELGIKMPAVKRVMLESRLSRRLRLHKYATYAQYVDYVFSEEGARSELIHMIDAVTTTRPISSAKRTTSTSCSTTCFRGRRRRRRIRFRVWSAGCSTGEEPYTIAMVMEEHRRSDATFNYHILATDISTKVLAKAMDAVYEDEKVAPVPVDYKKRYLLKSKDPTKKIVRVKPELRQRIDFRRLNFMDDEFGIRERFDVIFCRNVIIYFDRPTQERLIGKFRDHLKSGGILFLGHSETMTGMNVAFRTLAPTVYRKE